jgi:hypothetical protein
MKNSDVSLTKKIAFTEVQLGEDTRQAWLFSTPLTLSLIS